MKDFFLTKYLRLVVLSALIEKMKDKPLGKTKALKLAYLAQELFDIPLKSSITNSQSFRAFALS